MARSTDVKTPKCRVAFADGLFAPRDTGRVDKKSGEKVFQYQASLLFPKGTDMAVLHNAVLDAAKAEWGDKAVDLFKNGLIKSPFLDGDGPQGCNKKTGERHPGFAGTTFIRVMSGKDYPPKLFNKAVIPTDDKAVVYSGTSGYAAVAAYTWENPENGKGVSFSISMFQSLAEGERMGGSGGPDPDKFFERIEDAGAAPASTQNGAGAAGLFG